jgi:hypothetical protein
MSAYRPLALISLAFGIGAYAAILVHTDFRYWGLSVYAALVGAICLFGFGGLLLGSRRRVFVRGAGAIALLYGALMYALAFVITGFVYHLMQAPSPMTSIVTMLSVAFVSGMLFAGIFTHRRDEAS